MDNESAILEKKIANKNSEFDLVRVALLNHFVPE